MNRIARVLAMAPARAAMVRQPVQASLRPFKHGVRFASSSKKDDETQQAGEAGAAASAEGSSGELSTMDKMAKAMGWLGGFYSRRQVIMRASRNMYMECAEQAGKDNIYKICKLPDTFQSWFLVQQLHVWFCLVRLEAEGSDGKQFKKHLVQYFWEDVENRMRLMKVDDRNIQAETSRELLSMFYGLVFAYDEGLKNGDDVLAAAVWRNLFHASKAQATTQDLAVMVEYIRKEVQALDGIDSEAVITRGFITFGEEPEYTPRE